jgi:hypothetical protein
VDLLQRHQAAARDLNPSEKLMSKIDVQKELEKAHAEPLLPIEKHLIGWSLGIGVTLLVILALFNRFFPVAGA